MVRVAWAVVLLITASAWAQVDLTKPFPQDAQTMQLVHLDDVATGRIADAIGGPPGQIVDGKPGLGRFGGGLNLDGAKGWADITRPAGAPSPDKAITVECWVKFRRAAQGDILCRNVGYMMRLGGGITAYFGIDGKWRTVAGARPVPVGRWTHLAMTYDQADQFVRIYIDGRLDVARKPEGITEGKLMAGDERLRLGTNTWNTGAGELDGVLDEVRISSVARNYTPLPQPGQQPVPEGVNLLVNPGFELGLHGWRPDNEADGNGQWELAVGEAPEGRHFLRSRRDGGYGLLSYPVRIVPGKTHTFSVSLRADKPGSGRLSINATGLASGASRPSRSQGIKMTPQWQRFSMKWDIPPDFPGEHVYVQVDKPSGAKVEVDAASFVVGDSTDFTATDATQFGARLELRPGLCNNDWGQAKHPVTVFNNSPAARKVTVAYRLANWRGESVKSGSIFAGTPAPGETAANWTMPCERVGWFTLTLDTTVDGKLASRVPYVANVIQYLAAPDITKDVLDSPLGMNTHMERETADDLGGNLSTLSACGVKWIRAWWGWGMAEKQPGQFDWTEFDRQYNAVTAEGMAIMPILLRYYAGFEQAWAGKVGGPQDIQQPPYDVQQWGNFVTAVATRYKGRIHAYEVWNEPEYTMDAKTYAPILKMTYERVKAVDPRALVVGFGGVSLDYIRDTFKEGATQNLDVLSHHSYSELAQPFVAEAKLQQDTLEVMKQADVNVPVWHSEQGSGADGAGYLGMAATEEACAVNLVQSYLSTLATGVQKFFWFSAQTSPTYGWGVFYEDYIPRPRLVALNGLARLLQGRSAKGRLPLAEGRVAGVLLDGPAGPAAALWNLRDSLTLALPGQGLQLADMFCNPLEAKGAKLSLSLRGGRPVYVIAKGMTLEALRERVQRATVTAPNELPFTLTIATAGLDQVAVTVRNTGDGLLDADLQFAAAPALAASTWELRDLTAGGEASQTLRVVRQALNRKLAIMVTATLGGAELRTQTLSREVKW